MTIRTETFDDEQWQLVPRQATHDMLMDLKPRAGEIVKMIKEDGGRRLNFSCDFGLAYWLMLASAPPFASMIEMQDCECCRKRFPLNTMHSSEDGCWLCQQCVDGLATADKIERLEKALIEIEHHSIDKNAAATARAALAPPSPLCPRPVNTAPEGKTAKDCIRDGECGCDSSDRPDAS